MPQQYEPAVFLRIHAGDQNVVYRRSEVVALGDDGAENEYSYYECIREGCLGCGCPTFPKASQHIPAAIMAHLYLHTYLWHVDAIAA